MSTAISSSSGSPASSVDHRRHQLGERGDRRDFVGGLGVDGRVVRRVDDEGVRRGELAACPGSGRGDAAARPPAPATPQDNCAAKTMMKARIIRFGLKSRRFIARLAARDNPRDRCLANHRLATRLDAGGGAARPAGDAYGRARGDPVAKRPGRSDRRGDRQALTPAAHPARLAVALGPAAAATSAHRRRRPRAAPRACRARRCGPPSRTRISSASTIVDSRCAIDQRRAVLGDRASAPPGSPSPTSNRARVVASSKIRIRGFLRIARAIATRCFSPPESLRPRSPTGVS